MAEESSSEQQRRRPPSQTPPESQNDPEFPPIRLQLLQKDFRPDSETATTSSGIIRKVLRDDKDR